MTERDNSLTSDVVEKILAITPDTVPEKALEVARQVCLDGLAVMLAGSTEPLGVGRLVIGWALDNGGPPEASIVGANAKVPPMMAAFANGTMAHALDYDNFWHPRNHPMSPTLPAILALAEKYGIDGKTVLTAIVVAFEVQVRLRMASTGLDLGKGFHKPGTTGTMGSAAACGWLLGLDHDQLAMALGIAGSRVGSFSINTGTMTKSSHSGHAARMGVECAELAKRGWTASQRIFDDGGYFETLMGERHDRALLITDFGDPFYMVEPGIGFKKYPCNRFTQRPIDAALELREQHGFSGSDIDRAVIDVPPFDYVNRPRPASGLDAKFSIQYTSAVALLDGNITVDSFSNERRFSPDIEDLLNRVTLVYDPDIPLGALETLVRTHVYLKDGTKLTCVKEKITGMVGIPLIRTERLKKFYSCATRVMSEAQADQIVEVIDSLASSPDVRSLMDLVSNLNRSGGLRTGY
jgi:2-methylcitrate dehydratase PrpD